MKRSRQTLAALLLTAVAAPALAGETAIHVMKTRGCGCCVSWMKHLDANGFRATGEDMPGGVLVRRKMAAGVPPEMVSCHTATVEGYVIEGHVPAADIRRLLSERPEAVGLSVPDMPFGSPGMGPESRREAYDVHLIRHDGSTEVFSSYEAR
ncbi:hypothetical protein Ga0609869_000569 [Rhodovulum iodosum]|uniref:DUF411 domain-containing protein n=1 Tax=Rhodovulum iodosum TaxID=68291 RepID=A0ABV3XPG4_9RHOB|nr:DUF411 domain-containing protein [Rhodovulum robiginosum]RSK31491.1 DUF411 domain-containing protein [Rhodovulum robiginosum]